MIGTHKTERRCKVFGQRGVLALLVWMMAGSLYAQQWAEQLFVEKTYNFGAVARAAKVEHTFVLKNTTGETIHLSSVRSSCGCTQPRIVKNTAAPGEEATVAAVFDTRGFTGQRGAWLTVTIDRPRYAEVRLRVDGYIRTDVVLNPGQVSFGTVASGKPSEKTIDIAYAGRNNWEIHDVKAGSDVIDTELTEINRGNGRVNYKLTVRLSPDAPVGYFNDELQLLTNDVRAKQVPLKVEAAVVAPLTISPSPLLLGSIQSGKTVQRQLIVKGAAPFRILEITCSDEGFTFKPSSEAKAVHVIPCVFDAGPSARDLQGPIVVRTDLESMPEATIEVKGQVAAPLAGTN